MTTVKKFNIPKVEFYITNVCNLTCPRCNRFNDYSFKGWQRWSDYEEIHQRWAEKVQLGQVVILGGEPLLNPTICDWITGINRVLGKGVQVLTNGTRLNSTPGLYETMANCSAPNECNWIGISVHNSSEIEWYLNEVKTFLKGDVEIRTDKNRQDSQGKSWTEGADYLVKDTRGVKVLLWIQDHFINAAVHTKPSGKLGLYNNDPEEAHSKCGFVQYKSYHFIRGKLYKCGPVALFPEFDEQFKLELSDEDRELINSYHPLTIDEFDKRGPAFLENIDNTIPQCKFCPANNFTQEKIVVMHKKT